MSNQPKKVFESFRESMLGNTSNWKNLISDNISLIGPLAQIKGKEKFIEINEPFFASIKGGEVYQILESGNYIITQVSTAVEMPSGKIITLNVCEWYEIKENKIESLRVYFDTAEFINEMKPV